MRGGSGKMRLLLMGGIILFAVFKYFSQAEENPYTGETQYIALDPEEEIALGLQSAPSMIEQHGGLHPDQQLQDLVDYVGNKLVQNSHAKDTPYQFQFHLLADDRSINAFALPGGPCFITYALMSKLSTEDQLAGILGHEIGHVVARHSAARVAKGDLTNGVLTGVMAGTGGGAEAGIAQMVLQTVNMKYGRDDELQSDDLGVLYMMQSGYDPEQLIDVMQILRDAAGPNRQPEFQSTHPDPANRIEQIQASIEKYRAEGY